MDIPNVKKRKPISGRNKGILNPIAFIAILPFNIINREKEIMANFLNSQSFIIFIPKINRDKLFKDLLIEKT